jgi:hypothetical protein
MDKKMSATAEVRSVFARLQPDLYFRIKVDAMRRRISMGDWLANAARLYLATAEELSPDGE